MRGHVAWRVQLSAECCIITLVYIERLVANTGLTIHMSNWKRIVLGAILLASKVWDDQAVWNVDFVTIVPGTSVEDLNQLEKSLLEYLLFNVSVPASVYTKYYMDLRTLAETKRRAVMAKPLSVDQALKLEAMTITSEDGAYKRIAPALRRTKSMEFYEPKSPAAVLS